jgi:ketosteroid isomerase-like protein
MQDNHIADPRAREFVAALRQLEQDSDPSVLTPLFAEGATLSRFDGRGERTGVEDFWREYREQFDEVRTTFVNTVESEDQVALEWTSAATLPDGRPLRYEGVTVLDLDGEAIRRLRTYYDSAVFVQPGAGTAG